VNTVDYPLPNPTPWQPPPGFARLRDEAPLVKVRLPSGDEAWLVTRYEENRAVFSDPRFSRAAAGAPDAPKLQPLPPDPASLLSMDPPEHTRLRRLVSRAFNARRVKELTPRVEDITAGLLDAMVAAGPPADLVSALAMPLPIAVICELLGVPDSERARFQRLADTVLTITAHSTVEVRGAREELNGYFAELAVQKRAAPGDDLFSELVSAHDTAETLTTEELVALGRTLLTAGFHTTANQITLSVLYLLRHPEQIARLAAEPDTIEPTVEELLRLNPLTVGGGLIRIATEDVELGGVLIRQGEAVLPAIASANNDESVFADPEAFRLDRGDCPHIAFGHGMHYCLGAHLARLELRVVLAALVRQLPGLRLAVALPELNWNSGRLFRGLAALPVAW
jgi:cytochrome P450